ncbi:quinone oxidoreductase family protein [Hamadaea tsunoensis]|uniref:quinone oxidoreductase family protein n=1 Tax=Hamadaea tsunoensis TaxID=53368 RepID=UPI000487BC58|nr:zinc-binding dehydrogenase [Hamadaea tsunoensis]
MRAVRVDRFGGPEVLTVVDVPEPAVTDGGLLVAVRAAGVNFADTSRIAGTYRPTPELPFIPGTEVVGRTADGRRVLATLFGGGASDGGGPEGSGSEASGSEDSRSGGSRSEGGGFAEWAVVDPRSTVEVPAAVPDAEALALLVQGLTAWHILRSCARIGPGETVVVNAAAGGVGSLAVQLARHFGARRVIAVASTPAKRALAASLGAHAAVAAEPDGYAERVLAANDGRPVDIVLDSVGGPTFTAALDTLADFGRLVTFGNASRAGRPPVDAGRLADRNHAVAGFWLRPALAVPGAFREPLSAMFDLVAAGTLRPQTGAAYPLAQVRPAFEDLLARRTTGKITLRL